MSIRRTADGRASAKDMADARWAGERHIGHPSDLDQRFKMQYIGALSLLGRVLRLVPVGAGEHDDAFRAFVDANIVLRLDNSDIYFERAGGGYACFDIPKDKP
jgi:hypothetical protein